MLVLIAQLLLHVATLTREVGLMVNGWHEHGAVYFSLEREVGMELVT